MTDPVPSKDQLPQAMPASESPVTQLEIVSAINHHARELARLTATWPAPEPPVVQLEGECHNCKAWMVLRSDTAEAHYEPASSQPPGDVA
jgi:hypothetical protein